MRTTERAPPRSIRPMARRRLRPGRGEIAAILKGRNAVAARAARCLPHEQANELANTVAQRLLYRSETPEDTLRWLIEHRIAHGWISWPSVDVGDFARDLAAAWASGIEPAAP